MDAEPLVSLRNSLEHRVYTGVLKPLFFRQDPEVVHDRMREIGSFLGRHSLTRATTALLFNYTNPMLSQTINGINFANPIGLAAGFDKNAHLIQILPQVGFGWMEVGSITARPCAGNPKPRLHRLPKSQALVVNYGLMNDGSERLQRRLKGSQLLIPVGTSIAPTNDAFNMDYHQAIEDYVYSYKKLAKLGAYTTLNLSCPNTCNDQPFTDEKKLAELLAAISELPTTKPIFLKLSPDLLWSDVDKLLAVAKKYRVQGVICSNLTKKRDNTAIKDANVPLKGGISGKVVTSLADGLIAHVAKVWGADFKIVGCGGVFSAEDAYRKIGLGASLIQMITGLIYEGPQVVAEINQGLVALLKRDGYTNLAQAVGKDLKR